VSNGDLKGWNEEMTNNYFSIIENGTIRTDLLSTVENVLKNKKFIHYTVDCEDAAREQNRIGGAEPNWRYGGTYMLVNNNLQKQYKGPLLVENREKAMQIINNELDKGYPVMVGLSYNRGSFGNDENTNVLVGHFVNIVGRGIENNKNYYLYLDNYYSNDGLDLKRLYMQPNGTLIGTTDNGFIVTDVRNNIKYYH